MLNTLVIKGKRPTVVREKGRENIPKHRHSGSSGWVTVWDKGDGSCWHRERSTDVRRHDGARALVP